MAGKKISQNKGQKKKFNFDEKVWELLKKIPKGKVTTYGLIAKRLNSKAYRAVGQACKRNENAPTIPCHRVIESSGKIGNYSASGGIKMKIELLTKEGIKIKNNRIENFEKVLYKF
jgi:methylated-DNA-[protein]-cysteine S-methyltransferase